VEKFCLLLYACTAETSALPACLLMKTPNHGMLVCRAVMKASGWGVCIWEKAEKAWEMFSSATVWFCC